MHRQFYILFFTSILRGGFVCPPSIVLTKDGQAIFFTVIIKILFSKLFFLQSMSAIAGLGLTGPSRLQWIGLPSVVLTKDGLLNFSKILRRACPSKLWRSWVFVWQAIFIFQPITAADASRPTAPPDDIVPQKLYPVNLDSFTDTEKEVLVSGLIEKYAKNPGATTSLSLFSFAKSAEDRGFANAQGMCSSDHFALFQDRIKKAEKHYPSCKWTQDTPHALVVFANQHVQNELAHYATLDPSTYPDFLQEFLKKHEQRPFARIQTMLQEQKIGRMLAKREENNSIINSLLDTQRNYLAMQFRMRAEGKEHDTSPHCMIFYKAMEAHFATWLTTQLEEKDQEKIEKMPESVRKIHSERFVLNEKVKNGLKMVELRDEELRKEQEAKQKLEKEHAEKIKAQKTEHETELGNLKKQHDQELAEKQKIIDEKKDENPKPEVKPTREGFSFFSKAFWKGGFFCSSILVSGFVLLQKCPHFFALPFFKR